VLEWGKTFHASDSAATVINIHMQGTIEFQSYYHIVFSGIFLYMIEKIYQGNFNDKEDERTLQTDNDAGLQVTNCRKKFRGLVRQRTIPTERPPLVGEVSANFSG
jgi:hypothetical protein